MAASVASSALTVSARPARRVYNEQRRQAATFSISRNHTAEARDAAG